MNPQPRTPIQRVAIVGAGPAGLIAFAALRYGGVARDEIAVFDDRQPLQAWTDTTEAIRQRSMRSESDGHFFPTDYPGFALLDAVRRRSVVPLVRSALNRYHPSCRDVQDHGHTLAGHFGLPASLHPRRVARLAVEGEPEPHVVLQDETGNELARARHALLALGHGPLRWPEALSEATFRTQLDGRVVHAYQRKTYGGDACLVIGSGMAAATEWINILRAGGGVLSVRRSSSSARQALSAPRCYFSSPWLDRYHALDRVERARTLKDLACGTYPYRPSWESELTRAEASGRFRVIVGEIASVRDTGTELDVQLMTAGDVRMERVQRIIAATGFATGWEAQPLMRHLVDGGKLDVEGSLPVLDDDCSIPQLSQDGVTVSVAGPLAGWAFPAADSFAGMKYAARRFSERALGRSIGGPDRALVWARMLGARSIPQPPPSELCVSQ